MDTVGADGVEDPNDVITNNENHAPDANNFQQEEQPQKDAFDDLLAHYSNPTPVTPFTITEEQQKRIAENKRMAEEKRRSRLLTQANISSSSAVTYQQDSVSAPVILASNEKQSSEPDLFGISHNDGEDEELMDIDAIVDEII